MLSFQGNTEQSVGRPPKGPGNIHSKAAMPYRSRNAVEPAGAPLQPVKLVGTQIVSLMPLRY